MAGSGTYYDFDFLVSTLGFCRKTLTTIYAGASKGLTALGLRADGRLDPSVHPPLGIPSSKNTPSPLHVSIPNGMFEDGLDGWTTALAGTGAVAVDPSTSASGVQSALLSTAASGDSAALKTGFIPVTGGVPLGLMLRAMLKSGTPVLGYTIAWFDKGQNALTGASATTSGSTLALSTSAWVETPLFLVPPAAARYCQVTISTAAAAAANVGAVWVDELRYGFLPADAAPFKAGDIATGSIAISMKALFAGMAINALLFGMAADSGATDNAPAMTRALAYCATVNRTLYIPSGAGYYGFQSQVTASGNVSILGDGTRSTELRWTPASTSTTSGISITLNNPSFTQHAWVRDLLITTTGVGQGTGLYVNGLAGAQDRVSQNATVERVTVRGATNPTVDGWYDSFWFDGVNSGTWRSCVAVGKQNSSANSFATYANFTYNNACQASPHATTFTLDDCKAYSAQFGLLANDFEGGLMYHCQFVGNSTGYSISGQPPSGDAKNFPHFLIAGCHVNATAACGLIANMSEFISRDNLYYNQNNANTGVGLNINGTNTNTASGAAATVPAINFSSIGDVFENYNQSLAMNAIIVTSGQDGIIGPNYYRRVDSIDGTKGGLPVWLTSGATRVKVNNAGSKFGGANNVGVAFNRVLNSGTDCIVADSYMGATSGSWADTGGTVCNYGTAVVTTDANGLASIPYQRPFLNAFISATVCIGDGGSTPGWSVDKMTNGASPLANLYVKVFNAAGAVAANATVRIDYQAYGRDIAEAVS